MVGVQRIRSISPHDSSIRQELQDMRQRVLSCLTNKGVGASWPRRR